MGGLGFEGKRSVPRFVIGITWTCDEKIWKSVKASHVWAHPDRNFDSGAQVGYSEDPQVTQVGAGALMIYQDLMRGSWNKSQTTRSPYQVMASCGILCPLSVAKHRCEQVAQLTGSYNCVHDIINDCPFRDF